MKLTNPYSILSILIANLVTSVPLQVLYAKPFNDDTGDILGGTTTLICCGCILFSLIINIAILAWVVRDASSRGTSAGAWLVIVLLFGILGLLGYLVARPQGKLINCPNCSRPRPITSLICPHCGYREAAIPR